jgi:predicted nuclease of restriction endonuclease-like (RecB) superfamily
MLYERLALSRNKGALLQEAEQSQDTITPEEAIRDPYILEFLGLPEPYSEKDLESALIQHLADCCAHICQLHQDALVAGFLTSLKECLNGAEHLTVWSVA